jgi:hypothetical protein
MEQVYGLEIACLLNNVVSNCSVSIVGTSKATAYVKGIHLIADDV